MTERMKQKRKYTCFKCNKTFTTDIPKPKCFECKKSLKGTRKI